MSENLENHWIYSNFDDPKMEKTQSVQTDPSICKNCISRDFRHLDKVVIDREEVTEYLREHAAKATANTIKDDDLRSMSARLMDYYVNARRDASSQVINPYPAWIMASQFPIPDVFTSKTDNVMFRDCILAQDDFCSAIKFVFMIFWPKDLLKTHQLPMKAGDDDSGQFTLPYHQIARSVLDSIIAASHEELTEMYSDQFKSYIAMHNSGSSINRRLSQASQANVSRPSPQVAVRENLCQSANSSLSSPSSARLSSLRPSSFAPTEHSTSVKVNLRNLTSSSSSTNSNDNCLSPVASSTASIMEFENASTVKDLVLISSDDDDSATTTPEASFDPDPPTKRLRSLPPPRDENTDTPRLLRTCMSIRASMPSWNDRRTRLNRRHTWCNERIAKRISNYIFFMDDIVNEHVSYILTNITSFHQAVRALATIFWGGTALSGTLIPPPNQPQIKSELPDTDRFHQIWLDLLDVPSLTDPTNAEARVYLECIESLNKRLARTRAHMK